MVLESCDSVWHVFLPFVIKFVESCHELRQNGSRSSVSDFFSVSYLCGFLNEKLMFVANEMVLVLVIT